MLKSSNRDALAFLDYFSIQSKNQQTCQTILRDIQNNKLILMKEIQYSSHQEAEQTNCTLAFQKKLNHEQLLSLLDYYPQPTLEKIIVFYQYCEFSLADEFSSRIEQRRIFEESELWSILTSLIFGLQYLQVNNVGHGSVSLSDTYLNDCGFVKICDPTLATSNPFSFTEGKFYSPELLRAFKSESIPDINIFKSDVFCLGCCILEITLMRNIVPEIIDEKNMQICEKSLKRMLEELEYSQLSAEYIQFLAEMVKMQPELRPDFSMLKKKIYGLLDIPEQEIPEIEHQFSKMSEVMERMKMSEQKYLNNSIKKSLSKQLISSVRSNAILQNSIKEDKNRMLNSLKKLEEIYIFPNEDKQMNQLISKDKLNKVAFMKTSISTEGYNLHSTGMLQLKNVQFIPDEEQDQKICFKSCRTQAPLASKIGFNQIYSNFSHKKALNNFCNKNFQSEIYQTTCNQNLKNQNLYFNKQFVVKESQYQSQSFIIKQCEQEDTYTNPTFLKMMQTQVSNILKKRQIKL